MIIVFGIIVMISSYSSVIAYGPERDLYTIEKPADHVTFNSIKNNDIYGDERAFVTIKPVSDGKKDTWKKKISVNKDGDYYIRIYVHNNAAKNLKLIANNTRLYANIPGSATKKAVVAGQVESSNAKPKSVWDEAVFVSDKLFNLNYIKGSAVYYNNYYTKGIKISDSVITSKGALIGYNKLDGKIPGCFQYSGHLLLKVHVDVAESPSFVITKKVRKKGQKTWQKSVRANPGDILEYAITYENNGDVTMNDVLVRDYLPKSLSYIDNTLKIYNSSNPKGYLLKGIDNSMFNASKGLIIGNYLPKGAAALVFDAKLSANENDYQCGKNAIINNVIVFTEYGNLVDKAEVLADKKCNKLINICRLKIGLVEIIISTLGLMALMLSVIYWYKKKKA